MRNSLLHSTIFILSFITTVSIFFTLTTIAARRDSVQTLRTQRSAVTLHATRIYAIDPDTKMITFELLSNAYGMQPLLIATYNDTSILEDRSVQMDGETIVGYSPNKILSPGDLRPGDIGFAELAVASDSTFWVRLFYRNDILRTKN